MSRRPVARLRSLQSRRARLALQPRLQPLEERQMLAAGLFLQGTSYVDLDADGHLDVSEPYLPGATVSLFAADGRTLLGQDVTDAFGAYRFDDSNVLGGNLQSGTYRLGQTPPDRYTSIGAQAHSTLNPATVLAADTIEVTLRDPAGLSLSLNSSGAGQAATLTVQGSNRTSFAGQLYITASSGAVPSTSFQSHCVDILHHVGWGDNFQVMPRPAETGLGTHGGRMAYLYNHYGTVALSEVQAAGLQLALWELQLDMTVNLDSGTFVVASATAGARAAAEAYLAESAGRSESAVYLDATMGGQSVPETGRQGMIASSSFDFSNIGLGSLAGSVYFDQGNDGVRNVNEPGVGAATIILEGTDARGLVVRRTVATESDGSYRFDQLWPGTYALASLQPSGILDARDTVGTLGGIAGNDQFTAIVLPVTARGTGYLFGEHRAPVFTSTPIIETPAGKAYAYDAEAVDSDGDTLTFSLVSAPTGMTIQPATGIVTWSPTLGDVGSHVIAIRVDDGRGGQSDQHYALQVVTGLANRPPRFTSDPIVEAFVNVGYTYPAQAIDPDLDPLTFSLLSGPEGMTLDLAGVVHWTPPASLFTQDQVRIGGAAGTDTVTVPVILGVSDGRGGNDRQSYSILVRPEPSREPNRPPMIVTNPETLYRPATTTAGDLLILPATIRDFKAEHPDFEQSSYWYSQDLVETQLGSDRKPIFAGPFAAGDSRRGNITSLETFAQWYHDVDGVNLSVSYPLVLNKVWYNGGGPSGGGPSGGGSSGGETPEYGAYGAGPVTPDPGDNPPGGGSSGGGSSGGGSSGGGSSGGSGGGDSYMYEFYDNDFFPIDGQLFGNEGNIYIDDTSYQPRNFHFTMELHATFTYHGGEWFNLAGDDDLWIFINNQLVIDLGGVHDTMTGTVDVDDLGLTLGQTYNFDLFFAERHTAGSTLRFQTTVELEPDHPYVYDVDALDPDNDPLTYSLLDGPEGMAIDPVTGLITWSPGPGVTGSETVTVRVEDGRGGIDDQTYTLNVAAGTGNDAPEFQTSPLTRVNLGETYSYRAHATDPDGDPILYELATYQEGMRLDRVTGLLTWTPTRAQLGGSFDVAIKASDGRGLFDVQVFEVDVVRLSNADPEFQTNPVMMARAGSLYLYDADAVDADGDPITYDLSLAPSGMVVHPTTGVVAWVPRADQVGTYDVILRARDGQGGVVLQSYRIVVAPPNRAPEITSTPPAPALVGLTYHYQVTARDRDDDNLTYTLDGSPPEGMEINTSTGLLTWTASVVGTYPIRVRVSDPFGGSMIQMFDLPVMADPGNRAPTIESEARTTIRADRLYLYQIQATDLDNDPLTYSVQSPPGDMAFIAGAPGLLAWTPSVTELGERTFKVRVDDGRGLFDEQTVTVRVVAQDVNHDPRITSTPIRSAVADRTYRYQLTGADPDHDPILWGLTGGVPDGAGIDPQTGLLVWTPRVDQIGTHTFRVVARDHLGGVSAPQEFVVEVRGTNRPPRIVSTPTTLAKSSNLYTYDVDAVDPDDDPLTFGLVSPYPAEMQINATTGLVEWTPSTELETGAYAVTVRVSDAYGASHDQVYTIQLGSSLPNRPPTITSDPPRLAPAGSLYQYAITATDPESQSITFSVDTPAWLSYNPTTGKIQGTPPAAGTYTVTVRATDSEGAWSTQSYGLAVRANGTPTIAAMTSRQIVARAMFRFDVPASDPDGDALTYTLTSPPTGLEIDDRGRITWTPRADQITGTPYTVRVTATDPYGATSGEQTFQLTVVTDTQAPVVELVALPLRVERGEQVTFLVRASDNVGVESLTLTVNGQAVALDGRGAATVTMSQAGTITAVATAKDAQGLTGTTSASVFVFDPDNLAPTVALTAPTGGSVITTVTPILGSISDDAYPVSYTLTATPFEGGPARTLASNVVVNAAIASDVLGQFDPTLLANGSYVLRLEATDSGNRSSEAQIIVDVAGDLKLGNFRVSFTDLQIPVAGIPITVSRTYDSLNAHRDGDLGYGWRLDFGDMRVKVSVPDSSLGAFGDQVPFRDGTRVTITGPDGVPQGFTFQPLPYGAFGIVLGYYVNFVPDAGVTSYLAVPNQANILLTKVGTEYISLDEGGIPYNPADPAFGGTYDLISYDGMHSTIDAETGQLLALSNRIGNTLTFEDDGIVSDTGRRVDFERDPVTHRITALVDPRGNRVKYGYDAAGNLVSVTDRMDNPPVQFVYDPSRPHFLAEIQDPLGREAVRVDYDADGRVESLTDAAGKSLTQAYDPVARTQTSTDASSLASTTVTLSAQGDPTRVVDAEGGITKRLYSGRDVVSETVVVGLDDDESSETDDLTTSYTHDGKGNILTMTDPTGKVTRYTYDDYGQPTSMTDAAGLSTLYSYDEETGSLLFVTDPSRQGTGFDYYENGLVERVTTGLSGQDWLYGGYGLEDPDGGPLPIPTLQTEYDYNVYGDLIGTTDSRDVTRTMTYDANGNATGSAWTWVNPDDPEDTRDVTSDTEYDANDQAYHSVTPTGESWTEYDAFGRAWRSTDSLGNQSETLYDARGLVIWTRELDAADAVLSESLTVYDDQGRPAYSVDAHKPGQPANGTRTIYDDLGRVVETRRYAGMVIAVNTGPGAPVATLDTLGTLLGASSTDYDAAGRVTSSVDDVTDVTTTYEYDAAGRVLAVVVTPPTGPAIHTETENDGTGRAILSRDALGRETYTQYDDAGRVRKTTYHDGTFTTVTYDSRGRRVAETDQAGITTSYEYDAFGQLTAVVLPAVVNPEVYPSTTVRPRYEYEYDAYGNLALIRDAKGRETTFTYDEQGRRLTRTLPQVDGEPLRTETSAYDDLGRLESHTDFTGQVTRYSYDDQGRTARTEYFASAAALTPVATVEYAYDVYDSEGRHETVVDSRYGTTERVYDPAGQLIRITTPEGTIRYAYDPATGQKTRMWTARTDIRYAYDALGRLETVTAIELNDAVLGTPLVTSYTYDVVGNVLTTAQPNGTVETRTYDDLGRLDTIVHRDASNAVLASFDYTVDAAGHRVAVDELGGRRVEYTYDALDRLTRERILAGGSEERVFTYTYDLAGNRLTKTDSAREWYEFESRVTYTYDAQDRLLVEDGAEYYAGDVTYTYDANGNTLTRVDTEHGATTTYAWDIAGRMVGATIVEGAITKNLAYRYNDEGIRTGSTEDGQETKYLIDTIQAYDQVLEEYAPGGALAATYVRGLDLIFQDRQGTRSYYHADGLGSVRALSNAAGAVTDTYTYDAYGRAIGRTGTTANDYQFTGEQYDTNLEQTYLRARYYDASAGRFTRMDSYEGESGSPLTLHKFLYAHGDPVNNTDPSGYRVIPGREDDLGREVHAHLSKKFEAGGIPRVTRWGNRQIRTILRDLTGGRVTPPLYWPFTLRPDAVEVTGTMADIYEIKPGLLTSVLNPALFLQETLEGFEQLAGYAFLLRGAPSYTWGPGTSWASGINVWWGFTSANAPGDVLVTFNEYTIRPGVVMYEMVPVGDAVRLAARAALGTVAAVSFWHIGRYVALATASYVPQIATTWSVALLNTLSVRFAL
jgi:fibro-slime domain-containing protein/RHS repeat-associated protein